MTDLETRLEEVRWRSRQTKFAVSMFGLKLRVAVENVGVVRKNIKYYGRTVRSLGGGKGGRAPTCGTTKHIATEGPQIKVFTRASLAQAGSRALSQSQFGRYFYW